MIFLDMIQRTIRLLKASLAALATVSSAAAWIRCACSTLKCNRELGISIYFVFIYLFMRSLIDVFIIYEPKACNIATSSYLIKR